MRFASRVSFMSVLERERERERWSATEGRTGVTSIWQGRKRQRLKQRQESILTEWFQSGILSLSEVTILRSMWTLLLPQPIPSLNYCNSNALKMILILRSLSLSLPFSSSVTSHTSQLNSFNFFISEVGLQWSPCHWRIRWNRILQGSQQHWQTASHGIYQLF